MEGEKKKERNDLMFEDFAWKELVPSVLALLGVLAVLWVIFWAAKRAIRRMADRMEAEDRESFEEIERWAGQLTAFVRYFMEFVACVAALFIVMRGLGIRGLPEVSWEQVTGWLLGPGLRIVFVLGGAYVISRVFHVLVARLPMLVMSREGTAADIAERAKRAKTVTRLSQTMVTVVVMSIASLIALREMGLDITPILTGAGIAGLAVGFGAQNLVRDIIGGFFLILEDQVRVGDVAIINGKGGLVEAIRLRTIVLRGLDGTVHIFANGAVNELSNMTKDFSYYVIDMGVAYKENVDHVMQVMREVGAELQNDPEYKDRILGPLEIMGVDSFADSAVVIRVRIKTVPVQQWNVGRELRRRIKNTFDAKGIEIPFPHVSVYTGEASKPFAVQVAEKLSKT
jgi:small-conductance mechanosensitive channel